MEPVSRDGNGMESMSRDRNGMESISRDWNGMEAISRDWIDSGRFEGAGSTLRRAAAGTAAVLAGLMFVLMICLGRS